MHEDHLQTKIKNLSDEVFADVLKDSAGVSHQEAKKLVSMYKNMNPDGGEETLKAVIDNLELDADISVKKGGR